MMMMSVLVSILPFYRTRRGLRCSILHSLGTVPRWIRAPPAPLLSLLR